MNREVSKVKRELENEASKKLPWILEEVCNDLAFFLSLLYTLSITSLFLFKAEDFVKDNVFLATGFAGGFLLGLASS